MIISRCPGSCGELIEGIIQGSDKLISYPINCYSYVELSQGRVENRYLYPKAYKAVERVFEYFGEDTRGSKDIQLDIHSEIPQEKGMASSTADLGATILATATYLGKTLTQEEIAKLAISIEPTDSTLFSNITLFDHLKGEYRKHYPQQLEAKVLVLEGREKVDTVEYQKTSQRELFYQNAPIIQKALKKIEKGLQHHDLKAIGQGAIESAFAQEKILSKPGLDIITDKALKYGAYGINIAHSGSVLGILFDDALFDKEAFIQEVKKQEFIRHYMSIREYEMVKGGAEIVQSGK